MARKDDDFVMVSEKKSKGKIIAVIAAAIVLGIGGYSYSHNSGDAATVPSKVTAQTKKKKLAHQSATPAADGQSFKTVVNFSYDSVVLSANDDKKIQEFYSKIKSLNGDVKIDGYTDGEGSAEYNANLSKQRAEIVVSSLKLLGVDNKQKIAATGHGMDNPIAENTTDNGRAQNRRVELVFKLAQ